MTYLRVQCTPNLASADIGCVRYRNIHAEGAYSTLPLNVLKDCLVVLQSISMFFAWPNLSKYPTNDFLLGYHRHSTKKIFQTKPNVLRKLKTASSHLFLKKLLGFWQRMAGYLAVWGVVWNRISMEEFPMFPFFPRTSEATEKPYVLYVLYVLKICTCKVK